MALSATLFVSIMIGFLFGGGRLIYILRFNHGWVKPKQIGLTFAICLSFTNSRGHNSAYFTKCSACRADGSASGTPTWQDLGPRHRLACNSKWFVAVRMHRFQNRVKDVSKRRSQLDRRSGAHVWHVPRGIRPTIIIGVWKTAILAPTLHLQ